MREQLYNDMLEAGWNPNEAFPWIFGWKSWIYLTTEDSKEHTDV